MTPASELGEAPAPAARPAPTRALPNGTRLRDYEIQAGAGDSTIGIVYLAWDHSLQRKVAVKEYMPASMASRVSGSSAIVVKSGRHADTFKAGLRSFVNEARLLARFDHPSLVKVYRFWEENGTAYMVMPFYEGPTLKTALAELGHVPSEAELRAWLRPILDAVAVLHGGRTWHRNIGPDEILLTPVGPVLLGFGAAARTVAEGGDPPASTLAAGFAAPEQYGADADAACGPWTDLYALAAIVYGAIAGAPADAATDRLTGDSLQPLSQVASGLYDAGFLTAIDTSLALDPTSRPQDHAAFRARMGDIEAAEIVSLAPPRDLMQEPFLGAASASHREITVPDRPLLAVAPAAPLSVAVGAGSATAADGRHGRRQALPARSLGGAAHDAPAPAPTWMKAAGQPGLGKGALFVRIAAICVGIALAAVALQSRLRPPPPGPVPAATAPPASTAPLPTPAVAPPPPAQPPPLAPLAPSTPAADAASIATLAASMPSAATAAAAELHARCIDILQKASLEKISAADTEFFKKECK